MAVGRVPPLVVSKRRAPRRRSSRPHGLRRGARPHDRPVGFRSNQAHRAHDSIHRELKRKHVTLSILWDEYVERNPEGYRYSRFCELYRSWEDKLSVTMRLEKPLGDYLRSLYFDTICFEPSYARYAVDAGAVDAKHLVLGSDTPFPLGEPDPVGFSARSFADGTPDIAEMILHRNAVSFLGFAAEGEAP